MDELTRERFLAPPPRQPEPPHPYALILERQRALTEALAGGARDPVSHRAPASREQ